MKEGTNNQGEDEGEDVKVKSVRGADAREKKRRRQQEKKNINAERTREDEG